MYAGNDLDRGHLARRSDLLWGSLDEAQAANEDSFFFTNIAPQMNDFNQSGLDGVWGLLEDAVLEQAGLERRRLTLFGGPVLTDDDVVYRDVLIPGAYWKVVVYVLDGTPQRPLLRARPGGRPAPALGHPRRLRDLRGLARRPRDAAVADLRVAARADGRRTRWRHRRGGSPTSREIAW